MKIDSSVPSMIAGWVVLKGIREWESNDLLEAWVDEQAQIGLKADGSPESEKRREAVRSMLRVGGFKPSGRSKPAQEYLMRGLREGERLPRIFPAVDVLNATSVRIGLPISILQKDLFPDERVGIRLGRRGESYVFNGGGQEISLENLIVICGGPELLTPIGSPIKDSMIGKITRDHPDALAVIYGPKSCIDPSEMLRIAQGFGENLKKWSKAEDFTFGCE